MPIDTSIYGLIQQPKFDSPMENYGRMMTIKGLTDQSQLQGLQRQQIEKGIADEQMVSDAYRQSGGDPVKLRQLLQTRGQYKPLQALDKFELEKQEKQSVIGKNQAQTGQANMATQAALAKFGRDLIATATPESYPAVIAQGRAMNQQWALNAPESFSPDWQRSHVMDADKWLTSNTPKYERVDIGGRVQVVDMNPITNPAIKGTQFDKTATPGEVMTDTRTKSEGAANRGVTLRGQNLADVRAREQFAAGGREFDTERGVIVNTRNGTASSVTQNGQPLSGKLSENQKKQMTDIDAQDNTITAALKSVGENKDAFGAVRGLATMAGALPEAAANSMSTPEKIKARSFVFNVVSKVINERAGAAQSAQELARLRSFLPAEVDDASVIKSKLEGFQEFLREQRKAYSTPVTGSPKDTEKPTVFGSLPDPNKYAGARMQADDGTIYISINGKWVRK